MTAGDDDDWWVPEPPPLVTVDVIDTGLQAPVGFYPLKETRMADSLTPDEIAELRVAADLDNVMPTLDNEITKMRQSTEAKVYQAIAKGDLTPEDALAYWMEMYAYRRLDTRIKDRAAAARSITETTRR